MKIQIDLNDILGDEYGNAETLAESVRRQIIENIQEKLEKGIEKEVNRAIAECIEENMKIHVADKMPAIIENLLDHEYMPVTKWGEKQERTSFRKELLKSIQEQMVFKPSRYDSDKNAFTKAVEGAVESNTKAFQKEFNRSADEVFVKEAFSYAYSKLEEKFKVSN